MRAASKREAIHRLQRERRTLAGLVNGERKQRILAQHRHAQRLLRPLKVLNPYADQLTFLSDKTRTRRDHEKYLDPHRHDRAPAPVPAACCAPRRRTARRSSTSRRRWRTSQQANALAHEVLGRSLDELPPQTRRVLARVDRDGHGRGAQRQQLPRAQYRFSRREVREYTGLSDTQLRVHLGSARRAGIPPGPSRHAGPVASSTNCCSMARRRAKRRISPGSSMCTMRVARLRRRVRGVRRASRGHRGAQRGGVAVP